MKTARGNMDDFLDWLVDQVPRFDEEILEDMRPIDTWITGVTTGRCISPWWISREMVRKLAEGVTFKDSEPVYEEPPSSFRSVFPHLSDQWKLFKGPSKDLVPCDM